MSNLINSLNKIRSKIQTLEEKINVNNDKSLIKENTQDNQVILFQLISEFKQLQNEKIIINVGGKKYFFSKRTIENPLLKNIFSEKTHLFEIFYDGCPELFTYIADFLRFKSNIQNEVFLVIIKIYEDEIILKEMIKEVFLNEEKVFDMIKIEREVEKITIPQQVEQVNNNNQNNRGAVNYNYNNRGANYNYNY